MIHRINSKIRTIGIAFILISLMAAVAGAQTGKPPYLQWAWMKGPNTPLEDGVYGQQGVPAADNNPGSRYAGSTWMDPSGTFWLFGGVHVFAFPTQMHSDLWRFDPSTLNWVWINGSTDYNVSAVFGSQGVPSAANNPGARYGSTTWTDLQGNLWLFSGNFEGNDLWRFQRSTGYWTWMKGSNEQYQPGVYGTIGVPHPDNTPGGRWEAACWTDNDGKFWLFGGTGYSLQTSSDYLSDLWRFDPDTGNWTWIKGPNTYGNSQGRAVFGVQGVPDPSNQPGARCSAAYWKDEDGNLWLFGGYGFATSGSTVQLADLWRYEPSTGNWTWMKGPNFGNSAGIYGELGIEDADNYPGAREHMAFWADHERNLWLYGGEGFDAEGDERDLGDLWKYSIQSGNWTWMKDESRLYSNIGAAIYGEQGVPAESNSPGKRTSSSTWMDTAGNAWLFGGRGGNERSDLWRIHISDGITQQSGSLRVSISPQEAINAGAGWRISGTSTWRSSGHIETDLDAGSLFVEFRPVAGWNTPATQNTTINAGQMTSVTGIYTGSSSGTGSLRVTILPQEAIDAGAQWRRLNTATWRNSGETESGIPTGAYEVEYKEIAGWNAPTAQNTTIISEQTVNLTGVYTDTGSGGCSWVGIGTESSRVESCDALAFGPDGTLYRAIVNLDEGNFVQHLQESEWQTIGSGFGEARIDSLESLLVDSGGYIYMSGNFTRTNNCNVVVLDGNSWVELGAWPTQFAPSVNALALDRDGSLIAGGDIVAQWNGSEWTEVGLINSLFTQSDELYRVNDLQARQNGDIYACGQTITGKGFVAGFDGTAWHLVGGGLFSGPVESLVFDQSGTPCVGGAFLSVGGIAVNHLAMWSGSSWAPMGSGLVHSIEVPGGDIIAFYLEALVSDNSGNIYAAGQFDLSGDTYLSNVAQWDGTEWSALGEGLDEYAKAAICDEAGALFVGGRNDGSSTVHKWECSGTQNDASRFRGISTRGWTGVGDNVMIGGIIVQGSTPKTVLFRGIGPTMTADGVPDVLADPVIDIYSGANRILSNDNWSDGVSAGDISGTNWEPHFAQEAALIASLDPGAYTVILSGAGATEGNGLVEIYEWDPAQTTGTVFHGISTRGWVGTNDDVMIAGFIVEGNEAKDVVVRGIGRELADAGVPEVLQDPLIRVFSGATLILENDDWENGQSADQIRGSDFEPVYGLEAALIGTFEPGAYTVILSGYDGAQGNGLIEVYEWSQDRR